MTVLGAYLDAADAAASMIASPAVAGCWDQPSALPELNVSGLAGHLSRQITQVPAMLVQLPAGLVQAPPDRELITVLEHYQRAQWLGAGLDDDVNVAIRRDGDAEAADGPAALAERTSAAAATLGVMLPEMPADQVVYLPWTGWSLSLEDFLTTRLLEIVVHMDDLAVSVGTEPLLPEEATGIALTLLTRLAARRYGTQAVLRALSRSERAPATIAAL